jgi:hypothetical protein
MRQFSPLEVTVNRDLLKYAAGRAIFCPQCRKIMDAKTTVIVTTPAGQTWTSCAACWDKVATMARKDARFAELDIVDGRDLWNTKAARKHIFGGKGTTITTTKGV